MTKHHQPSLLFCNTFEGWKQMNVSAHEGSGKIVLLFKEIPHFSDDADDSVVKELLDHHRATHLVNFLGNRYDHLAPMRPMLLAIRVINYDPIGIPISDAPEHLPDDPLEQKRCVQIDHLVSCASTIMRLHAEPVSGQQYSQVVVHGVEINPNHPETPIEVRVIKPITLENRLLFGGCL